MEEYGGARYGVNSENYKTIFFEDELFIINYRRGRSSAQFVLRSETTGIKYYMFISDTLHLILSSTLVGGKVKGKFGWIKKGQNFGIYLVEVKKRYKRKKIGDDAVGNPVYKYRGFYIWKCHDKSRWYDIRRNSDQQDLGESVKMMKGSLTDVERYIDTLIINEGDV